MGTMAENDQIGEFKEAFNMFAKGSDKIDKETLKSAMRELGLKPTDEEVTQMIKDADSTGSGKVGFNEFYSMMTEKMSQIDSPADLRTAFECTTPPARASSPPTSSAPSWPRTTATSSPTRRFARSSRPARWRAATSTTRSSSPRWAPSKRLLLAFVRACSSGLREKSRKKKNK